MTKKKSAEKKAKPQKSRCWPGFEPVPGKKPFSKGSCRRVRKSKKAKKKSRTS